MNKRVIAAIAAKDIRAITSNSQVWLAMVILPLVFSVALPAGAVLGAKYGHFGSGGTADTIRKLIDNLPAGTSLRDTLTGLPSINHQLLYFITRYMMLPLFLLLPIITSSVVSANSFVGEKERHTLESLLFAPIAIKDLFIGKIAASFIPAMLTTLGSFILFGLVVDGLTWGMFDRLLFPSAGWLIVMFWLSPAVTLFSILINVLISARVKGFQEAQQLSGLIVLPVILLIVGQMTGVLLLSPLLLVLIGAVLLAVSIGLLPRIARMNNRNTLFEKQIH